MARPRSEEKQIALLNAATQIFAAQGLSAPTSLIAKHAGVAEGTLFRYFPTKNDLFNELFVYLTNNLSEALNHNYDATAPLKARTRMLWNNYIEWGITHYAEHIVLNQLAISEKISPDIQAIATKLCLDVQSVTETCNFEGIQGRRSVDFAEAILSAIAQVTITYAKREPNAAEAYKLAGFDMMWRGMVG